MGWDKKFFVIFSIGALGCFSNIFAEEDNESTFSEENEITMQESVDLSIGSTQPPKLEALPQPIQHKSVFWTVGLSALVPGLGNLYLGDIGTAGGVFGSYGLGVGMSMQDMDNEEVTLDRSGAVIASNAWFYGIYAAYRDVRKYNIGDIYKHPMPKESFYELASASFRPSIMKKPEVWGGILGSIYMGAAISHYCYPKENAYIACDTNNLSLNPVWAFPVGIGEEAFFRGFLQSALSENFTPVGGIVLSSLIFGAMHIPNAKLLPEEEKWRYYTFSLPWITTMGAYFSWLTYKNNSLKESVAVHSWYDFVVFLGSYSLSESALIGKPTFAFSWDF